MDQSEIVAFVAAALARETGAPVERKETHVSLIFLAGDLVFKLKRAVAFPYLDFSTPALREKACKAEIALNSRAARGLYLGLRRITRESAGLAFDGPGEMVDCIVAMRRFEETDLFDAMAREGRLTPGHIEALAETVARFHAGAERFPLAEGAAAMSHLLDLDEKSFAQSGMFSPGELARLNAAFRAELARIAPLLDSRAAAGFVRLCHGDLYLRNICLFQGKPTLFDCIEFDEALAKIDVLYDIAFTLMDLWLFGRRDLANLLFNRYASAFSFTLPDLPSKTRDGYVALPFFMALRAAIRAHIAAAQALEAEARSYFDLAGQLLRPGKQILIAIGGLSGSGKSTLAAAIGGEIGAPPGARTLNSDRTRKAMHRLRPGERLPPEAYAMSITQAVYLRLLSRAVDALAQGRAVIVDAVYSAPDERAAIEKLAHDAGMPFLGLWLEAAPDVLRSRVLNRTKGPSDANIDVLEAQLRRGTGEIGWARLDSSAPELKERALALVQKGMAKESS